jgi:hypothetical protein
VPDARHSQPRHLDLVIAGPHALDVRGREAGADQGDKVVDRDAMRQQERFRAAVQATGEEPKARRCWVDNMGAWRGDTLCKIFM